MAFHTGQTNNALFTKSAFTCDIRKTGQCPVSSVWTQLLGVGVITRLPTPSEDLKSPPKTFAWGDNQLVCQQVSIYKATHQQLWKKNPTKPFAFFSVFTVKLHVFDTATKH